MTGTPWRLLNTRTAGFALTLRILLDLHLGTTKRASRKLACWSIIEHLIVCLGGILHNDSLANRRIRILGATVAEALRPLLDLLYLLVTTDVLEHGLDDASHRKASQTPRPHDNDAHAQRHLENRCTRRSVCYCRATPSQGSQKTCRHSRIHRLPLHPCTSTPRVRAQDDTSCQNAPYSGVKCCP